MVATSSSSTWTCVGCSELNSGGSDTHTKEQHTDTARAGWIQRNDNNQQEIKKKKGGEGGGVRGVTESDENTF